MKRVSCLLIFLMAALASDPVQAQTYYTLGNGATPNCDTCFPTYAPDYYEGTRQQFLFRASELYAAGANAGSISSLQYTYSNPAPGVIGSIEGWRFRIGHTTLDSLDPTGWVDTGLAIVYGPVNYTGGATGATTTVTFTTPLQWDGNRNILLEVCHGDANSATLVTNTHNGRINQTVYPYRVSRSYGVNNAGNACSYNGTAAAPTQNPYSRPNIRFAIAVNCRRPDTLRVSSITDTTAQIYWSAVTGVSMFEYVVSTSATPPASGDTTSIRFHLVDSLVPGTTYYVHVRSRCTGSSRSGWHSKSFRTTRPCVAPDSLSVSGITSSGALLRWHSVHFADSGYRYVLDTSSLPPSGPGTITSDTFLAASGLTPNTSYVFWLRSYCDTASLSTWDSVSFRTLTASGIAQASSLGLQVFPNPAYRYLTVILPVGHAQYRITDAMGRTVQTGILVTGSQALPVGTFASGTYILEVVSPAKTAQIRFMKE